MKINFQKGGELMEGEMFFQIIEAINAIKGLFDKNSDGNFDGELLPQEVTDLFASLSDGEQGNNDIENILVEIKDSLMYDENYTALSEISSRLELIDTRLDTEFEVINNGMGLIIVSLITILSWKFFGWLFRLVSV